MKWRRRDALVPLSLAMSVTLAWSASAWAAAPTLDYLYPGGGQRGTTVAVTAGGAFDPWPVSAWADAPGLHVEAGAEKGRLSVRIEPDTPTGPHLIRLYNAEGASALRVFVVGDQPEAVETEPNQEISRATPVDAMPATLNGRLEARGDVDSYAVKLDAGQTLVASMQGRRLGAPMDPLLHLHDAAGNPVAFAHDGFGLDPLLTYPVERAGTFFVRVAAFAHPPAADVSFTGGPATVYRLSLTTGPFVRHATPAGVTRGTKATVQLFGWNLPGPDGRSEQREVDASQTKPDEDELWIPVPGGEQRHRFDVSNGPEIAEPAVAEPSNVPPALSAPAAVSGRIAKAGEEDAFTVSAKKDEKLVFSVRAGAMNSSLDATLRILDDAGKELATDDDGGGSGDPRLEWVPPADGLYRVFVADLNAHGGDDFFYRFAVQRPTPSVTGTLDGHEYRVAPGATAAVKLTVARMNGHGGKLLATATNLPPGISCADVEVPEAGGEVTVTLTAAADAKPAGGPIRIALRAVDAQGTPTTTPATIDLSKEAGQELVRRTEAAWLTVLPPAKP